MARLFLTSGQTFDTVGGTSTTDVFGTNANETVFVAGNGKDLGLSEDWVVKIVSSVGNYGESFERNLGKASPLKLDRGLNDLWTKGGLMYAAPLR